MNVSAPGSPGYALPPSNSAQPDPARRQLANAVQAINQSDLLGPGRELMLRIDPSTRKAVVQIVNSDTREVLDQMPSERVLEMMAPAKSPSGDGG
jgi:uncharacterized FlaG/YvyC family protein